jgi:acyl dehydratase
MWRAGETLSPRQVAITREQLVRYAGASGDYNPIHYDEERAREFGLPGVIAHGMLNMGLMAGTLLAAAPPGARLERYGVRFRAMVRPGETVTIRATVKSVEESAGETRAVVDVALAVEENPPAVAGEAVLVWPAP